MSRQKFSQQVMWTILITLLLVGCGAPAATPTPTSGPLPGSVAEGIEVTFDGIECTVSGPTELPIGEHSFVLKDLSGQNQALYVSYFLNGKTFQDLLDEQPNEPGVYWPKPSWLVHTSDLGPAKKNANGGEVWTYFLRKEGEHVIYIGTDDPDDPFSLWIYAPLWVIEAPSE